MIEEGLFSPDAVDSQPFAKLLHVNINFTSNQRPVILSLADFSRLVISYLSAYTVCWSSVMCADSVLNQGQKEVVVRLLRVG